MSDINEKIDIESEISEDFIDDSDIFFGEDEI